MSYLVEQDNYLEALHELEPEFRKVIAEVEDACRQSDEISKLVTKAMCASNGHQIAWTSTTGNTDEQDPPPGDYECLGCGETVTVRKGK